MLNWFVSNREKLWKISQIFDDLITKAEKKARSEIRAISFTSRGIKEYSRQLLYDRKETKKAERRGKLQEGIRNGFFVQKRALRIKQYEENHEMACYKLPSTAQGYRMKASLLTILDTLRK